MKRLIRPLLLTLTLAITVFANGDFGAFATCTGASPSRACSNCKYCGHCSKNGGTCGVCRRGRQLNEVAELAPGSLVLPKAER
jgi:hypothetical protein